MDTSLLDRPELLSTPQTHRGRAGAGDGATEPTFVRAVRTTGIYCRPSCPARQPKPENVEIYPSCAEAERAGYRPCKRCRPNEPSQAERHAEAVGRACRAMEAAESMPTLAALARTAGLSPYHFHRVFKAMTGVTPRAYASQHRAARLADELPKADTVTEAVYGAGFNAASRFYESATARLGMTPSAYRDGGRGTTIRFAVGPCSLGSVLVGATAKGICAILLGDDPEVLVQTLQDRFTQAEIVGGDPDFEATVARVVDLVERPQQACDLPLDIAGTAFQQRVWAALRAIPPGTTASYAEVARSVGRPKAVRAVAAACGANPVAVAIPCHRVVRTDGSLSGYRWGVDRKRALLDREKEKA